MNCETNAGTHDFRRALQEAQDLNQFFNVYQPRMKARTASFCMERAGHFDGFDQGVYANQGSSKRHYIVCLKDWERIEAYRNIHEKKSEP